MEKSYNPVSELLVESYTGGILNGLSVTNGYDNLLCRTALSVLSANSELLSPTTFSYDSESGLSGVTNGNCNASYSSLPNDRLFVQKRLGISLGRRRNV